MLFAFLWFHTNYRTRPKYTATQDRLHCDRRAVLYSADLIFFDMPLWQTAVRQLKQRLTTDASRATITDARHLIAVIIWSGLPFIMRPVTSLSNPKTLRPVCTIQSFFSQQQLWSLGYWSAISKRRLRAPMNEWKTRSAKKFITSGVFYYAAITHCITSVYPSVQPCSHSVDMGMGPVRELWWIPMGMSLSVWARHLGV